jgi:hypothetical protein
LSEGQNKELLLISNKTFTLSAIFAGLVLTCAAQCGAQLAVPVGTAADSAVSTSNAAATPVLATPDQPASSDASIPSAVAPTDASAPTGDWHFSVSPYLWFPGVHGGIGVNSTQLIGIHSSAADLLSHFRFGLMGLVEPSYKRIVMPLDIMWVRLGDDKALTNLGTVGNFKGSEFILTQKIGYQLVKTKMITIDALGGFRYWHLGQSVSFTTNTLNFSASQNWVDPLVGGRITGNLSPKVSVTVAGDVGGWGAGSQIDYQIAGLLGYRIKPAVALQVGYRYLAVDYRNGGQFANNTRFANLVTSGVVVGATINLK